MLIRGATILSQDPAVGDFATGDLLVDGETIVAVGAGLDVAGAECIDGRGMIAMPGLVDAHRHAWQGGLRMLMPNVASLDDYINAVHFSLAAHFRPRDMYLGTYLSAVTCLDAGITTMIDPCNNARTAAHTDACIDAYEAAGLRVLFMPGRPLDGVWAQHWPGNLRKLKAARFSSEQQLVTLGMYSQPDELNWSLARQLGLPILSELLGSMAPMMSGWQKTSPLGPDNIMNHCTSMPEQGWRILRDAGAAVTVAARSDAQYALEGGVAAYQSALDHGFRPGLGTDTESAYGGDMFSEMRVTFFIQRAMAQAARYRGEPHASAPVSVHQVLRSATIDGAHCARLGHRTGSLVPGKQADIILINTSALNLMAANNAAGAVVHGAERGNVDTVIVAGRVVKRGGRMLHVDYASLRRDIGASVDYLFKASGCASRLLDTDFPGFPQPGGAG
jgi:cytosine/adenosine deaminase-related metal-dependent hydrolase